MVILKPNLILLFLVGNQEIALLVIYATTMELGLSVEYVMKQE